MCGIIGYIGIKQATPLLLQGLRRLEYRGYDSAGIAVLGQHGISIERAVGRIDNLIDKIGGHTIEGTMGIAHTRWATHGGVTEFNAHPHRGCGEDIILVHNGIIENYRELRKEFSEKHTFVSQTDSEILAHLIESHYDGNLRHSVAQALQHVHGTYGLVVMHRDHPDTLICARMGSPLVIGMADGEYYVASDPTPLLTHTKDVTFLDDGEIAELTREGINIYTLRETRIHKDIQHIDWDDEQAQKQGYPHFMLKEIFDQPTVYKDALRGRIIEDEGTAYLGGLNLTPEEIRNVNRIVFVACGTAYHTGMIGKYIFERLMEIPCEVDVASEFRYRDCVLDEHTLVFVISQSGETADTLAAVREAKRKGAIVRGIVNVVGSTIARETEGGTYIHAGPELAVASTKAYTNMIAVLLLAALEFSRMKKMNVAAGQRMIHALYEIPEKMKKMLEQSEHIKTLAEKHKEYRDFLFLGRGVNYPVALEGSLKLKEISYIHSEGYPAGEMKHGVNALLDPAFPVFAIMTKNSLYEKMRSNIEEVRARGGKIILLATEGDEDARDFSEDIIFAPPTMELLEPLLNTLPLQLFAYHMAVALGRDVDRPRNLAKSVTVE
ncbi:glutamine--fructose-6-phosphate transaminase (isomerizing) [Candidatus Uhrbacteria bacterium]|nr:glutamine--fructose-6-phosphate transaminase (isomerizing) [Candidatus Uhrbacteria bacterium]